MRTNVHAKAPSNLVGIGIQCYGDGILRTTVLADAHRNSPSFFMSAVTKGAKTKNESSNLIGRDMLSFDVTGELWSGRISCDDANGYIVISS